MYRDLEIFIFSFGRMGLDRDRDHNADQRLHFNKITEGNCLVLRICSSGDGGGDASVSGLVRGHRHGSRISPDELLRWSVVSKYSRVAPAFSRSLLRL